MTAPASPVEPPMEEEFLRLVEACESAAELRTDVAASDTCTMAGLDRADAAHEAARLALHRWHREQVERAVREAVEADAIREWHHLTPWAGRQGQIPEADPHWNDYLLAASVRLRAAHDPNQDGA